MFMLKVDKDINLALTMPYMAEEIFNLSIKNRDYLGKWMEWLEYTKEVSDTKEFILSCLEGLSKESYLLCSIVYKGKIVGNIDLHKIQKKNKKAVIGYWLDEEANGKGIMSRALKRLCEYAFNEIELNRLVIECDVENVKSCAVAKRVGFVKEATLKQYLIVKEESRDFYQYCLIKE